MEEYSEKINSYGIVIQARMSSSRLPGKVLKNIQSKPMLQKQIERLKNGTNLPVFVATSDQNSDDEIEELCKKLGVVCFRGSLNNLVLRFLDCANSNNLTHLIRVGGDDPLIDPNCCEELVKVSKKNNYEFIYASNDNGWPYGCAAEMISTKALQRILSNTDNPFYLEHTIPFILENPDLFHSHRLLGPAGFQNLEIMLSVDYEKDFELVKKVFEKCSEKNEFFTMKEIVCLLQSSPKLKEINKGLHKGFER